MFYYRLTFTNGSKYYFKSTTYLETPHRIIHFAIDNGFMYKNDRTLIRTARRVRSDQVTEPVKLI